MVNFQRLRPTRGTLAALVGLMWALSFGAVRDFVWSDLRSGMIDLRGLARTTRALVWIGFALLAAMVGAFLFNDFWRELFPLVPLGQGAVGRGELLPVALVPVTVFMLTVAWSFVLAGALHSHPVLRLAAMALYTLTAASWLQSVLDSSFASVSDRVIAWGALGLVPLFFLLRWRARPRPAAEFLALLLPVSLAFLFGHLREVASSRAFGINLELARLNFQVLLLTSLVKPLLLRIGLDIAAFTRQAADWASATLADRLPLGFLRLLLLALLGWQLYGALMAVQERIAATTVGVEALAYAGALGEVLLVGAVWWLVGRLAGPASERPTQEEVAEEVERHLLPLLLLTQVVGLATFVLLLSGTVVARIPALVTRITGLAGWLAATGLTAWDRLVAVGVLLLALWLARRGQRALALYLALFGALHLWWQLVGVGRPLGALAYDGGEMVNLWWLLLLAGVAGWWGMRGRLGAERVGQLLFLLLITILLRATDFIENPFSPFFGFAGIGFIAFGLVWDSLTAGSWANVGTGGLPRSSRLLLYVGYVLLTVTVLNWALTTHNLDMIGEFTGNAALRGFERFGLPLLYALFPVVLTSPADAAT